MKKILILGSVLLGLAGCQTTASNKGENELQPVSKSYSNAVGRGTEFVVKIKGNKCIGTAKYKRNDRDYHFNSITEWDAVVVGDRTRCVNGVFKNYDSRNNEHIFTGPTTNIVVFIKGNPYYESF